MSAVARTRGLAALLLCFAIANAAVRAGTITGTVHAQGKPGTEAGAAGGKYDSRQFKFVERVNYEEMHDFLVFIEGPVATNSVPKEHPIQVVETKREIKQKGAMFSPHVLPVMVGTTVEWPNNDEILHNVFSVSAPRPFDLELYKAPVIKRVSFDKPGRVDVFCSIHTRMSCIVMVLENPFFVAVNDRGAYSITNVPAGTYKLQAWHERMPPQSKEIIVPPQGEVKMDFTLGINNLPKL